MSPLFHVQPAPLACGVTGCSIDLAGPSPVPTQGASTQAPAAIPPHAGASDGSGVLAGVALLLIVGIVGASQRTGGGHGVSGSTQTICGPDGCRPGRR